MDKSDFRLPSTRRSAPLRGQEDLSPILTQRVASVPASGVVGNAVISQRTRGGKSVNLPPSGAARTRRSAAATASAASSEVTPIPAPSRKSPPQLIPGNLSIADTRASIDAAVLADDSGVDVDDDSEECNFFGDMPNPDPEDLSPRDISGEFISLFVLSRKCQKTYSKSRKITTFYEALTVDNKSEILGDSPPRVVWDKFKLWRGAVKNRGKWTLDAIAESVFVISRHVHDHEEKMIKNGGGVFVDSRIEALVLMYKFFLMEINLAEEVRQSQNRAAAMSLSSRQQRPTNPSKPLPPNFCYDANKVCLSVFIFFGHNNISQRSSIFSSRLLASTAHPASAKGPSCSSSTWIS